jgi:hypothetical protein
VKTTKEEGVEIHFRAHNISGVEGHARVLGWGLRRMTSELIIHTNQTNQTTSWLMHSWSTFGARMNYELTKFIMAQTWGKPLLEILFVSNS